VEWGPDRWRLYRLALREASFGIRAAVAHLRRPRRSAPLPQRLLFAPQDLRTADPTIAADIYAGYFVFAGRALSTGGRSPFAFPPPSPAWGEALAGFGWLRHLRAADTALARANARALVDEFITRRPGDRKLAGRTHVVARRLLSFLCQSPLMLEGADHAFYDRFLRAVALAVGQLERDVQGPVLPLRRLLAAVALCYAGLCCEGYEATLRRGTRLLVRELERQILPDGGHVSRSPKVLTELLLDLLPLRQIYLTRGVEPPEALLRAIDRMLPMVRLFRHGDGALSHFNGMGVTAADHLATLLIYDAARAQPMRHAPHSGYERLEAGPILLVADVGPPPPVTQSSEAGAGCLSFELSSGRERIVVNCGAPRSVDPALALAARATAAHSTAGVADASSCRFVVPRGWWLDRTIAGWLQRRLGPTILSGPRDTAAERREGPDGITLAARNDGYAARFGLVHERRWRLAPDGTRLEGEDRFFLTDGADPAVTVRFHLATGVRASRVEEGAILLTLRSGETWRFEASRPDGEAADPRLDESVFFAAADGARRTEQIVVEAQARAMPALHWRFVRQG
jgi:uncharacterized heparinase superfamily protein